MGRIKSFMKPARLASLNILLWGIIALSAIAGIWYLARSAQKTEIRIGTDSKIDITPSVITAMREIGEWEFLSVDDEEMVDTTRKGFLSDDRLVRIYYGKLSLGINLRKAGPRWIEKNGDSIMVCLPPIELLDKDFIDEARTRAFIETGKWSDSDREALYRMAYGKMTRRCMTATNIRLAQQNAEEQFGRMLKALGAEKYEIRWDK